eukprot:TRINITY_DN89215_c0_g1_i1.p1 TRINITY_DN89215_c0_g1~~TRINITY_DN89215_c0_g1_i1.p1  ORF type:complete len:420 (-),score=91.37 TRINITY_DN89215_c0_g1_i1:70-1329(-)
MARKANRRVQNPQPRRRTLEQQQEQAVRQALEEGDLAELKELAFGRSGFCSLQLRKRVWHFVLGVSSQKDNRWRQLLPNVDCTSQEARVIDADVLRSAYSWEEHKGLPLSVRDRKRQGLKEVMLAVLHKHREKLFYFQGFHEIVLVLLEVDASAAAFHMAERVALFHFSDQLCCTFDKGLLPLLGVLLSLLQRVDAELAAALVQADCAEMHFAVPWVLTWFAHSLPRLKQQVLRLWDCLLVSHPATILYFVVALLQQHRDTILSTPREMPEMVHALQSLSLDSLNVDAWASEVQRLMSQLPPETLLKKLPYQQRQDLPRSSPVLNFPYPWMRARSQDPSIPDAFGDGIWQLAPIYQRQTDVGMARYLFRLLLRRAQLLDGLGRLTVLSLLGIAGVMATLLRALSSSWIQSGIAWSGSWS